MKMRKETMEKIEAMRQEAIAMQNMVSKYGKRAQYQAVWNEKNMKISVSTARKYPEIFTVRTECVEHEEGDGYSYTSYETKIYMTHKFFREGFEGMEI